MAMPDERIALLIDERLAPRVRRYDRLFASQRCGNLMVVVRLRWVSKRNLFEYDFERGGHLQMPADILASAVTMPMSRRNWGMT